MVINVAALFFLFLLIGNYMIFSFSRNSRNKIIWSGIIFILIGIPIAVVGVSSGMAYLGITGIGQSVPGLLAGFITFLNGIFILFIMLARTK